MAISFHNDQHPDLKADYVLANPPFNDSDWRGELLRNDKRWAFGTPPAGNANFAWVQHFIHHLASTLHHMIRHKLATFSHQKNTLSGRQMPAMRHDNPAETEEKPETHHNSPQMPKIVFSTAKWLNQ